MSLDSHSRAVEQTLPLSAPFVSRLRRFASVAAIFIIVVGSGALLTFWQRTANLATHRVPLFTPSSSVAFILAGLTLLLRRQSQDSARVRLAVIITSVAVAAVGFLDGLLYVLPRDWGSTTLGRLISLRMSPTSAVVFVLAGLGLLMLNAQDRRGRRPAQFVFILVALFTIAALGVSLFGPFALRNRAPDAAMSWPTALLFIILSLGALALQPEHGAVRAISVDANGGVVARRLLPAALLAPLLLCILCYLGYEEDLYDAGFGLAMLTTLNSAVLTTLVWRTAVALNQSDAETRANQAEIEELNARLRSAMAETHHRVRNNLQIISALADMQVMTDREQVPVSEMRRIGSQVRALAAVHDLLTGEAKTHSGKDSLYVDEVLSRLASLLQQAIKDRAIRVESDRTTISGRQASAIAVVTNELVINALKNSSRDVEVLFKSENGTARLSVMDRGLGFPDGFDPRTNANTGLDLVQQMAAWDLQGDLEFANRPEGGACVSVRIPLGSVRNESTAPCL